GHLVDEVAAGQPANLGLHARVDLQPLDRLLDLALLAPGIDRTPSREAADEGQRDVLPHGSLTEESLQPVGRDEHHSGAYRVGRVTKSARLAADHDLAGLRPAHPGQAVEQLLLALTFERGDTEHRAEAQRECDVVQGARL